MTTPRLATVLALCLLCFGAAPGRDYIQIQEFYWNPATGVRGDTIEFVFTIANNDDRDHWVEVQLTIDPVVEYTTGQHCPMWKWGAVCMHVLDINEYIELCPGDSLTDGDEITAFATSIPAHHTITMGVIHPWSWDVARLACLPPDIQPVAGDYTLSLYAIEWKQMGDKKRMRIAGDSAHKPFRLLGDPI